MRSPSRRRPVAFATRYTWAARSYVSEVFKTTQRRTILEIKRKEMHLDKDFQQSRAPLGEHKADASYTITDTVSIRLQRSAQQRARTDSDSEVGEQERVLLDALCLRLVGKQTHNHGQQRLHIR